MTTISVFSALSANASENAGAFETEVFNVIFFNEQGNLPFEDTVYLNGTNVNIGYGYDLSKQLSYYETDLSAVSSYPSTYVDIGALAEDVPLIEEAASNTEDLASLRSQLSLSSGIDGSAWELAQFVLNRLVSNSNHGLNPSGTRTEYDGSNLIIPPSYELVALEDMVYDGGANLVSSSYKIIADLSLASASAGNGNWLNAWTARTSAWYEIVIGSDKSSNLGDEVRQLRDGEVFGLYSQGSRSFTPNLPSESFYTGNYEPVGNTPNLTDNGEEAVTSLRFLQDNTSPAVSAIDTILGSIISAAELQTITIKYDDQQVINTQATNGIITAPNGPTSVLLIGGDYTEAPTSGITQGFTYNLDAPLETTLQSGAYGHDLLFGFSGTNMIDAEGNFNTIVGDFAPIPGGAPVTESNTINITGNHNNLVGGIENETINVSGSNNKLSLGGGIDSISFSSSSQNDLIVLNIAAGSATIAAPYPQPSAGELVTTVSCVRLPTAIEEQSLVWAGSVTLQWSQSADPQTINRKDCLRRFQVKFLCYASFILYILSPAALAQQLTSVTTIAQSNPSVEAKQLSKLWSHFFSKPLDYSSYQPNNEFKSFCLGNESIFQEVSGKQLAKLQLVKIIKEESNSSPSEPQNIMYFFRITYKGSHFPLFINWRWADDEQYLYLGVSVSFLTDRLNRLLTSYTSDKLHTDALDELQIYFYSASDRIKLKHLNYDQGATYISIFSNAWYNQHLCGHLSN